MHIIASKPITQEQNKEYLEMTDFTHGYILVIVGSILNVCFDISTDGHIDEDQSNEGITFSFSVATAYTEQRDIRYF